MEFVQVIFKFIDQTNIYFCITLLVLIVFSFKGTTSFLRYSLAGVAVFNALIATGVSLNSSEYRDFEYIAADYFAAAFFAAFSAFGLLSAVLITQRKRLLRSILIVNCTTLGLVAFYFDMLASSGLNVHSYLSQLFNLHTFKFLAVNVHFFYLLVLSLAIFVFWYTLRTNDQRRQRLIKSTTISMFVFWAVFLSYPLAPQGVGGNIYNSFPFDSVTRNLFYGFDIEATNRRYETRLHVAAKKGDLKKVRSLLQLGADPYAQTRTGNYRIPLDYAADGKNLAVLKLLLGSMDDINFRDKDDKSLVHIAARSQFSEFLEDVMRRNPGAESITARDTVLKWTPLHHALVNRGSDRDAVRKIRILLKNGADVNAEGGYGDKPLLLAVKKANVLAVEELLKHGADTDIRDFKKQTLLQVALESKQKCETECSRLIKDPERHINKLSQIIGLLEKRISQQTETQVGAK
ncbi:ankyrin repeat domain-containing protein [Roseibium sp. HPY-6]|uniref:ankyrin repeat domain-containing protein n=1 Tax=Roseibium sp. HPY-6 TaxID=3229852 RepID=UPI00338FCF23